MALGYPLHPADAVLTVHLLSDLGVGEGIPDDELATLLWGEEAVLSPPHPRPFQRGALSRDPLFCGGNLSSALLSPAQSLPAVASLPSRLSLLFQKG